jgi:hypothetical protein
MVLYVKINITYFIISRSFLLRMRNVAYKSCSKNTQFVFRFFLCDNRAVCERTWKNILQRGRPQMTIWLMRISCWTLRATNTYTRVV